MASREEEEKKKKKQPKIEMGVPEEPEGTRSGKRGERSKKLLIDGKPLPKGAKIKKTPSGAEFVEQPGFSVSVFGEGKNIEQEPQKGFKNVAEVLKAAVTGREKVRANIDNRVFRTGAEYVANNPFATALILTGMTGIAKKGIASIAAKKTAHLGIRPPGLPDVPLIQYTNYAKNTKTARQSAALMGNVLAQFKKPIFALSVIGASIGTYPWAEWSTGEAMEIMSFTTKKAIDSGNPELIAETLRQSNEIYDPAVWEQIGRMIPMANIAVGFNKKFKALLVQKKANDILMTNAIEDIIKKAQEEEPKEMSIEERKEIFQRKLERGESKKLLERER